MTLHRLMIGLLQPLLALLLFAGVARAEPVSAVDDSRVRSVEQTLKVLILACDQANESSFQAQFQPSQDDSDGGPDLALTVAEAEPILDQADLIRIGSVAYPTAPPSHRPCAAPSTGPPLA